MLMDSGSSPESLIASLDAAIAKGTARETCFRSRASIQASSSKSVISPAICTGKLLVSKREMRLTPLLPARIARQNASLPIPFGLTTPIPVMTARFAIDSALKGDCMPGDDAVLESGRISPDGDRSEARQHQ